MRWPRLLALGLLGLGIFGAGCGDDEASDPADAGLENRDFGFLRPDRTEPADAELPDRGFADARPDAQVDAGTPADGGDQCSTGPRKPPPATLQIINGTRQASSLSLTDAQLMAVVGVTEAGSFGANCSGTLIAAQVVLTAAHCTEGIAATDLRIIFGEDDFDPALTVSVSEKLEHPLQDFTLLSLATNPAAQIAVQPIPIFRGLLDTSYEGRDVEAAGYGDTQSSATGRFFVTVPIETIYSDSFEVNGGGGRGICFGDSGGPGMLLSPEGDVRVVGVISYGDAECAMRDVFVRTDVFRSYIETVTGPTPGTSTDECANLGRTGICDGQVARWCDRGVVRERDCAACGEVCLYLGPGPGFDCHVDPLHCGELDYLGWCNGSVSEWCNEMNERETYDCADDGLPCGFVDDELGYTCVE